MVEGVSKAYGSRAAVADVSFSIAAGQTLGLLGPNGAGKSTTVNMIAGILAPDSGRILVAGEPIDGETSVVRRRIGFVPQDLALYEELSALDNLRLCGGLYGLQGVALQRACAAALEFVGLADRARERVAAFSGGMKRRLNIAAALLHEPQVLLLDEPTVGVDPQSRNAIFDNLEALRARGVTLVYTTHYMEEAERLCDRVVIIDHGRVLANDTLNGLVRSLPANQVLRLAFHERPAAAEALAAQVASVAGVQAVRWEDAALLVNLDDLAPVSAAVLRLAAGWGLPLDRVGTDRASLEDVFLSLTGRSLRDA